MAGSDLRVIGGSPARGLEVQARPDVVWRKLGTVCQLLAWIAAFGVPIALLRGGPEALFAAVGSSLTLHALGYVLRHTVQHLVVAPRSMVVRSEQRIGTWRLPFAARVVEATRHGAIVVARERHAGGADGPRWLFVVRVLPDQRGTASVPVYSCVEATEALQVAAQLGQTLEVPARDLTEETRV